MSGRPGGFLIRIALGLPALLAGCGGLASPDRQAATTSKAESAQASKLAQAQATHEYPASAPREIVAHGSADEAQAVRAFALRYINWNAINVTRRMRGLAAASVGQARSAMALVAAQTAGDYELHHGGIANTGIVEAVAPLPGRPDQYVVVTREQTKATNTAAYQGLRPAWHVTLATVLREPDGQWVLSSWQPQS